jgi:hypothetical protein
LRNDCIVGFRTEESIKASAEHVRAVLDVSGRPDFRIIDCFRRLVSESLLKSGPLKLRRFKTCDETVPAFISFKLELTLNISEDVWEDADENLPWPRRVLAHELGHICLHDHYALPFSGQQEKWVPVDERSGEWQADRFLEYYLVSDADVYNYVTPNSIAAHCAVEYEVALRRLGRKFRFAEDICPSCGNLTTVRSGTILKCDTCGWLLD